MTLSDFFLAVGTTAFRGPNTEQKDAIKRIESEYGIRPDRSFTERYRTMRVPKPAIESPPIASFVIPPDLRAEFCEAVGAQTILAKRCTGFGALTEKDRVEAFTARGADLPFVPGLPIYGHVTASMTAVSNAPVNAAKDIVSAMGKGIGRALDEGFLHGTGINAPMGILPWKGTMTVRREAFVESRIASMHAALAEQGATDRHVWFASNAIKYWDMKEPTFKPARLIYSDLMPTALSRGCLLLVDPSWYAAAIRWESAEIAVGIGNLDELIFFFGVRGNGAPLWTPLIKDETSPFVALGPEQE